MYTALISRLFQSFEDLDRAIEIARITLETKEGTPIEILDRIRSYQDILHKQRSLATALCGYATIGNWDEVARHIKLINGLSNMIREDAKEILEAASEDTRAGARSNLVT